MSKTLIYRLVLTALAYLGLTLQVLKDGPGTLLYYTVLSNLLVASFLTYLVSRQLRDGSSRQLLGLKGGVTMSIMITFAVYHLMLAPRAAPEDYWNLPDSQRAELIDGQLYAMAPPYRIHQKLIMEISAAIQQGYL